MLRYSLSRLLLLVPLLFGLSVLTFLYMHLIPGDPIAGMLGPGGSPQLIQQLRHQFGLDEAVPVQYWHWLVGSFIHGNLGISFGSGQAITPMLINRIPATLQLTAAGMLFTVLIGLPAGFFAGVYKDSWVDRLLSLASLVGLSTPPFWLGTLLILFVSIDLHWLPAGGYVPLGQDPAASLSDTIMPGFALGLSLAPYLARMTRAATVEIQQEQFVKHARAKGLRRRTILLRYSARNAILPVVVVLGLQLGRLLGGQVIIEELFNWPGVGRLLIEGAIQRDYAMVQALVLIIAATYVVLNLVAELLHAALDPRIRL
jgi:peptide/nickel transport system permease protein